MTREECIERMMDCKLFNDEDGFIAVLKQFANEQGKPLDEVRAREMFHRTGF